jgi:hypothetical protein
MEQAKSDSRPIATRVHARLAAAVVGPCLALLTTLGAAPSVDAQPVPAELPESWMSSAPSGPASTGIVPSIWLDRRGLGFSASGTLAVDLFRRATLEPGIAATDGILLELGGYGGGPTLRAPRSSGALSVRLHIARPNGGVWLASTGFQSENSARTLPSLGAGLWLQRGRLTMTAQVMRLLDPLRVALPSRPAIVENPDTTASAVERNRPTVLADDVRLMNGAEASLSWGVSRLQVESRVGMAAGARRRSARWGELGASFWARPELALFARARTATATPDALVGVRGAQAALGVQLAPARLAAPGALGRSRSDRGFPIRREGDARRPFVLRVTCHRLEFRSDATGWSVIDARNIGSDRWELPMNLGPGIHRIEVRIDGGAWGPPPGLATAVDEFGGVVGLIVVQ